MKSKKDHIFQNLILAEQDQDTETSLRKNPFKPIPAGKFKDGIEKALDELENLMEAIESNKKNRKFELIEIEVGVSLNADGKLLGFGIGGETSITLTIRPRKHSNG
jgi:hypothetical protein